MWWRRDIGWRDDKETFGWRGHGETIGWRGDGETVGCRSDGETSGDVMTKRRSGDVVMDRQSGDVVTERRSGDVVTEKQSGAVVMERHLSDVTERHQVTWWRDVVMETFGWRGHGETGHGETVGWCGDGETFEWRGDGQTLGWRDGETIGWRGHGETVVGRRWRQKLSQNVGVFVVQTSKPLHQRRSVGTSITLIVTDVGQNDVTVRPPTVVDISRRPRRVVRRRRLVASRVWNALPPRRVVDGDRHRKRCTVVLNWRRQRKRLDGIHVAFRWRRLQTHVPRRTCCVSSFRFSKTTRNLAIANRLRVRYPRKNNNNNNNNN